MQQSTDNPASPEIRPALDGCDLNRSASLPCLTNQVTQNQFLVTRHDREYAFPLVRGNYAANAGLDLSTSFKDDIDGTTRTDTWDIGADEGHTGTDLLKCKILVWREIEPQ